MNEKRWVLCDYCKRTRLLSKTYAGLCSLKCMRAAERERKELDALAQPTEKVCEHCGKVYVKGFKTYCSRRCSYRSKHPEYQEDFRIADEIKRLQDKHWTNRMPWDRYIPHYCPECGEEAPLSMFCSSQCEALNKPIAKSLVCPDCNEPIDFKKWLSSKQCCFACYRKHHDVLPPGVDPPKHSHFSKPREMKGFSDGM